MANTLEKVRAWANEHAAQWVLDLLTDEGPAARGGPFAGRRCCDMVAESLATKLPIAMRRLAFATPDEVQESIDSTIEIQRILDEDSRSVSGIQIDA
jgi:hypothetical protein